MRLSEYESYQNTGYAWIGALPAHWKVVRLRYLCICCDGQRVPLNAEQRAQRPGDIPYWGANSIMDYVDAPLFDEDLVLLGEDGAPFFDRLRPVSFFSQGPVWPNNHVHVLQPIVPGTGRFLSYALNATDFADFIDGSTRDKLTQGQMNAIPIPWPSCSEQVAIAAFLDRETAKIDALVEEQKRLIELLKEKRQAIIFRAVTKGLDPNVPMKDPGVEWLGDVPEHWEVSRVGYRYEVQLGRMLNEQRTQGENMRPYLRVLDVQWDAINVQDLPEMDFPPDVQARYRLRRGDLLVNEGGSYVGRSAIWQGEIEECYYQKALHRLRPYSDRQDTAEFFLFVMEMATQYGVFVAGGNQTTIDHLTAEQFRSYRFAFPPIMEQYELALYLRAQLARLQSLVREAEAVIALLQERRAALISAAITGKIDVRPLFKAGAPLVDVIAA